jgi:hypothetical protein
MTPTSKLNKALLAKIEKLSTPEEKASLFLEELQGSGSIKSDFATEYLSLLVEIMEGAEEDDAELLQEKAERVKTLISYLDSANLGKREKSKLTEASNKVHKQLKSTALKKIDIRSKAAGIIDKLSENAGSIASAAFADDPILSLLGKGVGKAGGFVADKLKNSFRKNKSSGRKSLKADAQSLLGKATRKPKSRPGGGGAPEEAPLDDGFGYGGSEGSSISKAMVKLTQKIATDTQSILSSASHLTKPIKDIASNMQEVFAVMTKEMAMRLKATGKTATAALGAMAGKRGSAGDSGSGGGFGIWDYMKGLATRKAIGVAWKGTKGLTKMGWRSSASLMKRLPKNPRMLALAGLLTAAAAGASYFSGGSHEENEETGEDGKDSGGEGKEDDSIWGVVKSTVSRIMKVMGGAIGLVLGPLGNLVGYLMTGLASIFSISKLTGFVTKIGKFIIDTLWWGIDKMFQGIVWLAKTTLGIITSGAEMLFDTYSWLTFGLFPNWKTTTEMLAKGWKWLSTAGPAAWKKITDTIGTVWSGLTGIISSGWETAKSWFSAGWGVIEDTFGPVFSFLGSTWDVAKTTLITGVTTVKELGGKLIDPISQGISFISDTFSGAFSTFWGWIQASSSWLGSWFTEDMPDKKDIEIDSTPEAEIDKIASSAGVGTYDGVRGTSVSASGPNPIKRVIESGRGYLVVERPDGSIEKLTGALNWRQNNPGNLEYGKFAKSMGAIGAGGPGNRFAIFPSYEAGVAAQKKLIFESSKYKNLTLLQMINKYAPPSENNTQAYYNAILAAGGGTNKRMSEYSAEQQEAIARSMHKQEGFKAGKTEVLSRGSQLGPGSAATANATAQIQQIGAQAAAEANQTLVLQQGDTNVLDQTTLRVPPANTPLPSTSSSL